MSKRSSKKQAGGTIDIDTFKSWLQGVEDMQPDDWCPSIEQWRKIRQKIDLLEGPDETYLNQPAAQPLIPAHPVYRQATPIDTPQSTLLDQPKPRPMLQPAHPPTSLDAKPSDSNVLPDGSFQSTFM